MWLNNRFKQVHLEQGANQVSVLSYDDWASLDHKWRCVYDTLARAVNSAGGVTSERHFAAGLDELRDAAVVMHDGLERALGLVGWPCLPREGTVGRDGVSEVLVLYQARCRFEEAADVLREEPIHRDFEFFLSQLAAAGELIAQGARLCASIQRPSRD
jgi:hypothetical protein